MDLLLLQAAQQTTPYAHFLLILGIFVIMYFFMIRPQSKKMNEQRDLIESLQKGDKVVTIGGIHGRIAKVNEATFLVEVSSGTKLKVEKSVISAEFTKLIRNPQEAAEA